MQLEIEQKYPLDDADGFRQRLERLPVRALGSVEHRDTYYNHPSRDFAQTDEALRIRRTGDGAHVTYKGPKIDSSTKTRKELELPLLEPGKWPELLGSLGFREVATVAKQRERFSVDRAPFDVEVCIDCVEQVGDFVELEIVADESRLDAARQELARLAEELELASPERRSYLELQLDATGET